MSPEDGPTAVGSIEESELAWFEAQPTESILDLRVPTMVHSLYGTAAMHSSSTFLYMEGDELPGEPVLNEEGKEHEVRRRHICAGTALAHCPHRHRAHNLPTSRLPRNRKCVRPMVRAVPVCLCEANAVCICSFYADSPCCSVA